MQNHLSFEKKKIFGEGVFFLSFSAFRGPLCHISNYSLHSSVKSELCKFAVYPFPAVSRKFVVFHNFCIFFLVGLNHFCLGGASSRTCRGLVSKSPNEN
jgi:hypothetical protein